LPDSQLQWTGISDPARIMASWAAAHTSQSTAPGRGGDALLDDIHGSLQRGDLLVALDVAHLGEQPGRVDDIGARKGVADLLIEPVPDGAFRGSRAGVLAEPGDGDAAALDVELPQPLDSDLAVVAAGLTQVAGPVLNRRPARRGRGGDRGDRAAQREDDGDVRVATAADMAQIARVGLEIGRVAGVVRADDDIDPGIRHAHAHGFPAPVALAQREPRIWVKRRSRCGLAAHQSHRPLPCRRIRGACFVTIIGPAGHGISLLLRKRALPGRGQSCRFGALEVRRGRVS
jgi:hypothetical protein